MHLSHTKCALNRLFEIGLRMQVCFWERPKISTQGDPYAKSDRHNQCTRHRIGARLCDRFGTKHTRPAAPNFGVNSNAQTGGMPNTGSNTVTPSPDHENGPTNHSGHVRTKHATHSDGH